MHVQFWFCIWTGFGFRKHKGSLLVCWKIPIWFHPSFSITSCGCHTRSSMTTIRWSLSSSGWRGTGRWTDLLVISVFSTPFLARAVRFGRASSQHVFLLSVVRSAGKTFRVWTGQHACARARVLKPLLVNWDLLLSQLYLRLKCCSCTGRQAVWPFGTRFFFFF